MSDAPDTDEQAEVPAVLELDHVFEALAHPRRRYVLYTLCEGDRQSLWDLSRQVAAWEHDVPAETVTAEAVQGVYVSLYHNHVPKLAADDIVDFVEADETVRTAANTDQVLAVLEGAGGAADLDQEAHARSNPDGRHS